jgi:hypothetical protein
MDAVCASLVNVYQTKRHQIPEDSALHNQRHENNKSYTKFIYHLVYTTIFIIKQNKHYCVNNKSLIRGDYPFIYSKELGAARTS